LLNGDGSVGLATTDAKGGPSLCRGAVSTLVVTTR